MHTIKSPNCQHWVFDITYRLEIIKNLQNCYLEKTNLMKSIMHLTNNRPKNVNECCHNYYWSIFSCRTFNKSVFLQRNKQLFISLIYFIVGLFLIVCELFFNVFSTKKKQKKLLKQANIE
jgi:hypothetical protein